MELSFENLRFMWEKLSQFDNIFGDDYDGTFESFIAYFIRADANGKPIPMGIFYSVDDVGVLYLTDMIPYSSAMAHFTFWDRKIRGREGLIRAMISWTFKNLGFHRIETRIPLYARATYQAAERIGFVKEGRLRQATKHKGSWYDVNIYSMLSTEVKDGS